MMFVTRFMCIAILLLASSSQLAVAGHYSASHWKDAPTPTVLDYTPNNSTWDAPMYNAVSAWNSYSAPVNMGWSDQPQNDWACDSFPAYRQICLGKTRMDQPWCGAYWSTLEADGSGYHIYSVRTKIDAWCATTQSARHEIACHELGHALGLGHRAETSTCMDGGSFDDAATSNYPDGHDVFELDSIVYAYPEGSADHSNTAHVGTGGTGGCKAGALFKFPFSIFDVFAYRAKGVETEAHIPGLGYTAVPLPWSYSEAKPGPPTEGEASPLLVC